jgi:hypothetical protein
MSYGDVLRKYHPNAATKFTSDIQTKNAFLFQPSIQHDISLIPDRTSLEVSLVGRKILWHFKLKILRGI